MSNTKFVLVEREIVNRYELEVALKEKNISRNVIQTLARECLDRWNPSKGQGSRVVDNWLDINKRTIINKTQIEDWRRTINGEGES